MATITSSSLNKLHASQGERQCFHCGLPVDDGLHEHLIVFDQQRDFCCHGCKAVCKTILDSGLDQYYRSRDLGVKSNQQKDLQQLLDKLSIYDNEKVQKSFVHGQGDWQEAYLILEGIRCSACIWLNELHLRQQPGVLDVHIDDITQRARVRWDPEKIALSEILATIVSIGYEAHPYEPSHYLELQKKNKRKNLKRLLFAIIIGMIPMHFALATWFLGGEDESGNLPQWEQLGRWSSLFVTFLLLAYPGQEFYFGVWSDLKRKIIGMDVPIVLGLSCAYLLSAYSTIVGHGEVYYESITMFILFILISRRYEHQARILASDQLERLALAQPIDANLVLDDGQIKQVSVTDLKPGQTIQLLPGAEVPVDCEIISGHSSFNESLITGESKAIEHSRGDRLMSGSVNYDQPVIAKVLSAEMDSTIAEITRLAESGLQKKPVQALLADKVATHFVIFILIIAALTSSYWLIQGNEDWLVITISVLIVTCPCALALAVPIALTLSSSRFLRLGVLPINMSMVSQLGNIDYFVFDKTGTLTEGNPRLVDTIWISETDQQIPKSVLKGLVSASEHPIARALRVELNDKASSVEIEQIANHVGLGLEGDYNGRWRFGRLEFIDDVMQNLDERSKALVEKASSQHYSISGLAHEDKLIALFLFEDSLREGISEVIQAIKSKGIVPVMLSGDTRKSVQHLSEYLGIDEFFAELKPEQKLNWVQEKQAQGHKVAMIGDGINDAPTLATADVSFSLSESTSLANNHSDFLLLGKHLSAIPKSITLAHKTMGRMFQNIGWAILYNIIAIPFAVAGMVPPWMAAIGMSLSSVVVVMNSLRLDRQSID